MMKVNAMAVGGPKDSFKPLVIERRDLGGNDVLIEIKYAGICHSDIHTARNEWQGTKYPIVPGHEIAGVVAAVGSDVKKYKVGDHVGVGCMVNSCRECDMCHKGEEQYCHDFIGTYGAIDRDGTMTQGGYSTHVVVDADFVLSIPDSISLDVAAPLLCAGITTYSPLNHYGPVKGKRVAVIGLGGLGHMAVKIAHAMGAEVTVLSHSLSKKEDGLRFGAKYYYATSDVETFSKLAGYFDLIINTVSAKVDLDAYISLLAVDGRMVNVGAPAEPLSINVFSLIMERRSFSGSLIGGIRESQEMLDFCAEKGIAPEIEIISADRIDEAYERMLKSDVRYRFVIDSSTLGK